jgi:hypothetical protein
MANPAPCTSPGDRTAPSALAELSAPSALAELSGPPALAELTARLPPGDPAVIAAASAAVDARPIPYALGSGEGDEVALYAGIKPLVRQVLPEVQVAAVRVRWKALGLAVAEAKRCVDTPSTLGRVLYVGRDAARAREAAACESSFEHDRELGQLLGYPRCCVDAYMALRTPQRNIDAFANALASTRGRFAPRLNTLDLAVFHYVSWLPCSFSCERSCAFADAVADHIAKRHARALGAARQAARSTCPPGCRHERFVQAIDDALAAHRLVVHEEVQVSIAGAFDGHGVRVDRCWPTARDRHPDARLVGAAREATLRLTALVSAAGRVAVERGVLLVDGARVLTAPDALLVPFGAP